MKLIIQMTACSMVLAALSSSCKQRAYNQSRTKDLIGGNESSAGLCVMASPNFKDAAGDAKASVRVSCQGQCNGADYRNRKFYVLNEEKTLGIEFAIKLTNQKEMRNLFVFAPENGLLQTLNSVTLENPEVQNALANYSLDPSNIAALSIPADAKILLSTGTKASLSTAGLMDGGTLDCGGQPIDGAVDLVQFKEQNLKDVKNAAALP